MSAPESLLMRWVDDYVYITTSKCNAERFLYTMHTSLSTFGCNINVKKTMLNFDLRLHGNSLYCIHGDWFPWCGFLLNCKTLEISHNYLQYIGI